MKRWITSVAMASVVIAWTSLAQAEEGAAPKKAAPKGTKMQCEIVSVNAEAKTIEVKMDDKTVTLALSEKYKIRKDGKDATLADLKAGEKCTCMVYDKKDGSKSVGRITVGEEPKKEPKKKTAE